MRSRSLRTAVPAALLFGALLVHAALAHPARAASSSCNIQGVDRVVAIGDIHGAYDRLVAILGATHLIDDRQKWTGGKTHLVQLGDVVDRGPDSRKALELLRRLEGEASRAGGAVHLLLGNHEMMRMLGDLRYVTPGEYAAFVANDSEDLRKTFIQRAKPEEREQLLKETPLGEVELRLAFGRDGTYGKWLRTHDTMVMIDGVLFLHGGISAAVAPMSCDAINDGVRRELTDDLDKTRSSPLTTLVAREDGPLFYRGLAQEADAFAPTVDQILAAQHARAIVVAHTVSTSGRINLRFGGKVIQIDTGMQPAYVQGGRASALEILHGVISAIYEDRTDVLRAGSSDAAVAVSGPRQ